jgi:hypothetical protein
VSKPLSFRTAQNRQTVLWGCLWGIAAVAGQGVSTTGALGFDVDSLVWLLAWTLEWCATGCLHLVVTHRAVARGGRWWLVGGWLGVAVAFAVCVPVIELGISILASGSNRPGPAWGSYSDRVAFNLWPSLFYGGLLVAGYALALRTERTRSLLQDAAIARSRTHALCVQAELAALQQHVDPALLLDVMGEVEHRYRDGARRADELLNRLVDFLRCAMPGLKGPSSTLHTELQLVQAYVQLQRERSPGSCCTAAWTITEAPALPDAAFPGQLLLPLMGLAAAGAGPRLTVCTLADAASMSIEVHDLGQPLPTDFIRQARLRLQSLFGPRFVLDVDAEHNPQLRLQFSLIERTSHEERQ